MEREVLLSGIGGQGIQLAARSLAHAAIADGRRVQLGASYGGMMRGGNSESTLVIATDDISAPPSVSSAWAGLVMHTEHSASVFESVRPGGIVLVNGSVLGPDALPEDPPFSLLSIPALAEASELGAPVAASLVLAGALAAATGLVSQASLLASAESVLPSYRSEAADVNRRALARGFSLTQRRLEAWNDGARDA